MPDAEELWKHGLCFIGVIKTEKQQFLMAYLSNIEFHNWGDMSGFLTRPVDRTQPLLGTFFWVDRTRRYFIFTQGPMEKGRLHTCTQWRQDEPAPNEEPNIVDMTTPQPIKEDMYYSVCGKIDMHNRCSQESLDIEKRVGYEIFVKSVQFIYLCDECGQCLIGIPRHHWDGG